MSNPVTLKSWLALAATTLAAYLVSFGPACWLIGGNLNNFNEFWAAFYWPIYQLASDGPDWIYALARWYGGVWSKLGFGVWYYGTWLLTG